MIFAPFLIFMLIGIMFNICNYGRMSEFKKLAIVLGLVIIVVFLMVVYAIYVLGEYD